MNREIAEENMKLLESVREFKMLLKNVRNASCWQVLQLHIRTVLYRRADGKGIEAYKNMGSNKT